MMKCNVGSKERALRLGLGTLAAAVLLLGNFEGLPKIILAVIAVAGLVSGLFGFCPLNCMRKPKD